MKDISVILIKIFSPFLISIFVVYFVVLFDFPYIFYTIPIFGFICSLLVMLHEICSMSLEMNKK